MTTDTDVFPQSDQERLLWALCGPLLPLQAWAGFGLAR